jgi:hypothetical protein
MTGKFLDRAGWHGATCLKVPDCITLVPLPAYSPELNSVERIWEHLIFIAYSCLIGVLRGAGRRLRPGPSAVRRLSPCKKRDEQIDP